MLCFLVLSLPVHRQQAPQAHVTTQASRNLQLLTMWCQQLLLLLLLLLLLPQCFEVNRVSAAAQDNPQLAVAV
jgi:hypothetical protein